MATAVANQPTITGGPGSYQLDFSWSGTNVTSYNIVLYQSIPASSPTTLYSYTGIATSITSTSTLTNPNTYYNLVSGASYYFTVQAVGSPSSSVVQSPSVYFYNPYGGPQGPQGVQGIGGLQGPTGCTGGQGPAGVQGLMQINNFTVSNQLVTTSSDTVHLNANSGLTWNGSTLNIGGNIAVTSINNTTIGGVVITSGALSNATAGTTLTITGQTSAANIPALTVIPPSGSGTGYTISAGGSNLIGGVTLNGGSITGAGSGNSILLVTNGVSVPTVATAASSGMRIQWNQISAGSGNLEIVHARGATASGGIVFYAGLADNTAPTTASFTIGSTGISCGTNTVTCGAITSSGALGLAANGITSGTHNPNADNTYNLGTASTGRWANVYATTFTGALTGSVTGSCSGSSGSCTGNSATATNFSGTPNISVGTIGCGAITGTSTVGATGFYTVHGTVGGAIASTNYLVGTFNNLGTIIYTINGESNSVNGQLLVYKNVAGSFLVANTQWTGGNTQLSITCNAGINYTIYAYGNSYQSWMCWNLVLFPTNI